METRRDILILLGVAALLFVIAIIFYFVRIPLTNNVETKSPLEVCNTLKFNSPDAINLLFFSQESEAERYMNYFLGISPINSYNDAFNFYYITPESYDATQECELYKDVAILCHSRELIKAAGSCPNDYITVLKDEPAEIRSTAYQNVMSINSVSTISVFAHEFGHVFANLAEEYVPASIPAGSLNCQATCESFKGEIDECFEGCSRASYHRSVESGLMRTLRTDYYGVFNENLIIQKIQENLVRGSPGISGQAIFNNNENCINKRYFLIELEKGENIEVTNAELKVGCPPGGFGSGNLEYNIYNENGAIITSNQLSDIIFTDLGQETELIEGETFEQNPLLIAIPAVGETLEIEYAGQIISFDLSEIGKNTPCRTI